MTQHDQMAQMFAAIDADGQRYVLAVLKFEVERVQRARRPALNLIQGGAAPSTAPARQLVGASVHRLKIKELG